MERSSTAAIRLASPRDRARVAAVVMAPLIAQGAVLRRPRMLALADRWDTNRKACDLMGELRGRYGDAPLSVDLMGRRILLLLSPGDVRAVLSATPRPFTPAGREKRAALAHFQPDGVLISPLPDRDDRRRFNEAVLDTARPVHRLADAMAGRIREEAAELAATARGSALLTWDAFAPAADRVVRRIVLGDGARDDQRLTELLRALRADANWSYLRRPRHRLRERFTQRLRAHLERAEPGSLASLLRQAPRTARTEPEGQVPHWLFAYDAVAMTTFTTLAVLAAQPDQADQVREELARRGASRTADPNGTPRLRACFLETLRLWPTTPVILRETTDSTPWHGGTIPPGVTTVTVSTFFHRDPEHLPHPDLFMPERWLDGDADPGPGVVPFTAGPAECPGRNLVLFTAVTLLAALLEETGYRPLTPGLAAYRRLPCTVDHTALRLRAEPAPTVAEDAPTAAEPAPTAAG
ncbi:cytochrome P450 [Streptomyces sp. XD-27]|uniref:cytochrome P450 n=1 Tax=Streptomyces sp. XD-27 TaxID=3062779 RepID=UPI0026F4147D|nr:cytochrome P450 [Streptomyces sp. XD-27]WKX73881.1 cytochrome P450 [Streptomyces sp. XD-27]